MTTNARNPRIHGIVLAGVHAWGEGALERVCSRPLLPVAGRPLIWYVLHWLCKHGVPAATVCANSDTRAFRRCLGTGTDPGLRLDYYEDIMPRGPAGCMRDAALRSEADVFVVVDSTIITQVDLDAVLEAHGNLGADLTVVVSGAGRRGGALASGFEPAGIYVVSRRTLDFVPARGYQDIKETLIPALYRQGRCVVPCTAPEGSSLRVTGAASYLAANGWVAESVCLQPELCLDCRQVGETRIHDSAQVAPTACLLGPVLVGPNCTIEGDVMIVGPTTIGDGSYIERDVVIRQSVIWSSCRIGAGAILDDSVVVEGSIIDSGMVLREAIWMNEADDRARTAWEPNRYWAIASVKDKQGRSALRAPATAIDTIR